MKFEKINGMEFSRFIAANLLSDSSYQGDKYYEKEDELTAKIEKCLEKAELDWLSKHNISKEMDKQSHLEDIKQRLEEREQTADEDEIDMILEYYEDWLADDEQWMYTLDEAIYKVLGSSKENEED